MDSDKLKRDSQKTVYRNYKRLTELENSKILDFLKKNQPLWKPTAEIYYSRLKAEHDIIRNLKTFRDKVRTLKMKYFKLKKWSKSEEAEKEKSHLGFDNIQDVLLKKCPLYYEMEQAFGKQIVQQNLEMRGMIYTEEENRQILDFLIKNQPIGEPYPKKYFLRLIVEHGIARDLRLLRFRVRNMRVEYFKLKKWAKSEQAEIEKSRLGFDNIQDYLLQKCPLYYEMEQAFDENTPKNFHADFTTPDDSASSEEKKCQLLTFNDDITENFNANSTITTLSNNFDTAVESTSPLCDEFAPSIKMEFEATNNVSVNVNAIDQEDSNDAATASAAAMQALTQTLNYLVEAKRQKIESDFEFKEKELHVQREILQLQKKMFQFEKEKHYENMRLEAKEIENNEKYKIMEQKMKETIALREREMNERIELAKIENTIIKQEEEFLLE